MAARGTVQSNKQWRHSPQRWAYVISEPGEPLYASHYVYHTAEAAQAAGDQDAASPSLQELLGEDCPPAARDAGCSVVVSGKHAFDFEPLCGTVGTSTTVTRVGGQAMTTSTLHLESAPSAFCGAGRMRDFPQWRYSHDSLSSTSWPRTPPTRGTQTCCSHKPAGREARTTTGDETMASLAEVAPRIARAVAQEPAERMRGLHRCSCGEGWRITGHEYDYDGCFATLKYAQNARNRLPEFALSTPTQED
jgi:hypothetical protein